MANLSEASGVIAVGNIYDRTMRSVVNVPDCTGSKVATYRRLHPVLEVAESFSVQTYRHRELGDTLLIEYASPEGLVRIALPPGVCRLIHRQAASLGRTNRKKAAKQEAARRKAAGIMPAFMEQAGKPKKKRPDK